MRFSCEHLTKIYQNRGRAVTALDNVTLTVEAGEFVCIIGSSGCGKTTLLKLIAGLLTPTSGRLVFDGEPAAGRPSSALVFQEHGLFPWMTVVDNVAFGMRMRGVARAARIGRATELLERVGLAPFLGSFPHELSAGMRQRVSLARAFLFDADTLLMDEPFASLDALTKLALQQELLRTWEGRRSSVVFVTHDIEEAVVLGDRVLVMAGGGGEGGRLLEEITIPLPRPRDPVAGQHATDIKDISRHIWTILEGEVRKRLSMPA